MSGKTVAELKQYDGPPAFLNWQGVPAPWDEVERVAKGYIRALGREAVAKSLCTHPIWSLYGATATVAAYLAGGTGHAIDTYDISQAGDIMQDEGLTSIMTESNSFSYLWTKGCLPEELKVIAMVSGTAGPDFARAVGIPFSDEPLLAEGILLGTHRHFKTPIRTIANCCGIWRKIWRHQNG